MIDKLDSSEMNFKDLLSLIVKHKVLFCVVFLLFIIGGLIFGIFQPKTFTYRQAFSLPQFYSADGKVLLVSAEEVISKIKEIYLPEFILKYNQSYPESNLSIQNLKLKIYSGGGSPPEQKNGYAPLLVFLSLEGNKKEEVFFEEFSKFIMNFLVNETQNIVQKEKEVTVKQIDILAERIEETQKTNHLLEDSLERLTKRKSASIDSSLYMSHMMLQDSNKEFLELKFQKEMLQHKLDTLTSFQILSPIIIYENKSLSLQVILMISIFMGLLVASFSVILFNYLKIK